jgi:gliding motility-associated protein GldM
MSGGKETGRQKMIGMMYLVLTALLALNVSNAVLEKFAIIDVTLGNLITDDSNGNEAKVKAIASASVTGVKEDAAKKKALDVRALTKETLEYLDGVKKQMATEKDGKKIEDEELVTNTNRSEELMLDHQKPQIGEGYEKKLDDYVGNLNKIMGLKKSFPKLTRTALDYDAFKNGPHKDKKFLDFSFEGVPTMAAIATVSQMKTEILEYEKQSLDSLMAIVKGKVYEVDQMVPMVNALSSKLVAGQTYEGDLFVAGSASGVTPKMFFGSTELKVEEVDKSGIKVKMGRIKFPVRGAGSYDANGIAKGTYHVKVNLPGRAVPLETDIPYEIVKPSPRFASASSSSLYQNCGNEVNVSIPGLTDVSGIELSVPADQGTKIKLGPGKFAIIPSRKQCNVSVLLDGGVISTEAFTTKDAPTPVARVMYGNTQYADEIGLPPGTANIRIEPEILQQDFLQNNKKDANYIVSSFTLVVKGSPVPQKGGSVNLAPYNLRSGDSFTISNVKVTRSTYDGRTLDVLGSKMSKVIKIK